MVMEDISTDTDDRTQRMEQDRQRLYQGYEHLGILIRIDIIQQLLQTTAPAGADTTTRTPAADFSRNQQPPRARQEPTSPISAEQKDQFAGSITDVETRLKALEDRIPADYVRESRLQERIARLEEREAQVQARLESLEPQVPWPRPRASSPNMLAIEAPRPGGV